jgi:tRNA (mo5U34)-methyltransferase
VLATDHTVWHPPFWGSRRSFELARSHVAPAVEVMDIDLSDLRVEIVGAFDIVLFAGVLYHLKNPIAALEQLRPLVRQTLILETHLDALAFEEPAAIFYTHGYGGDGSNWLGPNRACVEGMLHGTGFTVFRFTTNPTTEKRGIFHAKPA